MDPTIRTDFIELVGSLRAYLETTAESGATGIPRGARAPSPRTAAPQVAERPQFQAHAIERADASSAASDVHSREAHSRDVPSSDVHSAATTARAIAPAETREAGFARLPILQAEVKGCIKCDLGKTRIQTVFSRGNPKASLCFVGEAPGADEDASGVPFVGRAGQLLDKMITAMGLSPSEDVYVCNIIKCRPPDNRRPTQDETDTCMPYLHEQLSIVKPKAIVALGNTAVGTLLGTKLGITKIRGQWKLYRGTTLVMPTYHPSYLLRPSPQQTEAKRQAWADLQLVMKELGIGRPASSP